MTARVQNSRSINFLSFFLIDVFDVFFDDVKKKLTLAQAKENKQASLKRRTTRDRAQTTTDKIGSYSWSLPPLFCTQTKAFVVKNKKPKKKRKKKKNLMPHCHFEKVVMRTKFLIWSGLKAERSQSILQKAYQPFFFDR